MSFSRRSLIQSFSAIATASIAMPSVAMNIIKPKNSSLEDALRDIKKIPLLDRDFQQYVAVTFHKSMTICYQEECNVTNYIQRLQGYNYFGDRMRNVFNSEEGKVFRDWLMQRSERYYFYAKIWQINDNFYRGFQPTNEPEHLRLKEWRDHYSDKLKTERENLIQEIVKLFG